MSHGALQAALVIALHDETFVDRYRKDPDGVLAPLGLDAAERAQLCAVDPRALRTDPLRRRRTLRTLTEELKTSSTLMLAETRSLAFAEDFFRSPCFAAAVTHADRPMTLELARYLDEAVSAGRLRTPLLADVVRLEATMARCRRAAGDPVRPGVALAPGVAVGNFDGATLEVVQRVEQYLFEVGLMPQVALCDDAPRLPPMPPPRPDTPLYLLFTPSETGISLSEIDAGLFAVLSAFSAGVALKEVRSVLLALGIPADQLMPMIESLMAEGILSEGPPPGAPLLA